MLAYRVLPALLLAGCLVPTKNASCTEGKMCNAGEVCNQATGQCEAVDMAADLSAPPDLSAEPADLTQPDLSQPDLRQPDCVEDTDCPTAGQACKGAGFDARCVTCALHADCRSGVCDVFKKNGAGDYGACIAKASLVYVDNANGDAGCKSGGGDFGKPVCTLSEGLAKLGGGKTAIRVAESSVPYDTKDLSGKKAVLYGPADNTPATGLLASSTTTNGVDLAAASDVTLDGFRIVGKTIGISCTGGHVLVRRSLLKSNSGVGLSGAACTVEIDRAIISKNKDGGVNLTGADNYSIQNSFIVNNTSATQPAVLFNMSHTGKFRFNTVSKNSFTLAAVKQRSGMDCVIDTGTCKIEDSIVALNDQKGGTQFDDSASFELVNVVVGTDSVTGTNVNKGTPQFVGTANDNFRLTNADDNKTCCIDKAGGMIDYDIDGTHRPQPMGGGYDIGAFEFK